LPGTKYIKLIISFFLITACSRGEGINYLNQACDPYPHFEIFVHPEPFENIKGGACFFYQPTTYTAEEEKRLAATLYYALKKQNLFMPFSWGGIYREETFYRHCAQAKYLVLLEGSKIYHPSKVTPGKIALSIRIDILENHKTIWHLSGELPLCPSYARNFWITLSQDQAPYGDLSLLQSWVYFLGRVMASLIAS